MLHLRSELISSRVLLQVTALSSKISNIKEKSQIPAGNSS